MLPDTYQELAARTECDQSRSLARIGNLAMGQTKNYTPNQLRGIRVNHAVLGMSGEVGELAGAVERWLYYGKGELDLVNVAEELGDLLWYIAELCNATGLSMTKVMEANIEKLRTRYPDKFSEQQAHEEGRDRVKEHDVLKATMGDVIYGKEIMNQVYGKPEPVGTEPLVQNGHGWAEPPYDENEFKPTKCVDHDWATIRRVMGFGGKCGVCGEQDPISTGKRTKSQVLAERGTVLGCCDKHADRQTCDCLENAIEG